MILERRLVTAAVKQMVETGGGKPTEVTFAPVDADLKVGYFVIHSIPGGGFPDEGNALVAPNEAVDVVYQVDGVSSRHDGAEWLGDRLRHVFLARGVTGFQVPLISPAGWACIDRRPDGGPSGVDVVGVRPNAVFQVAERFTLTFTPS